MEKVKGSVLDAKRPNIILIGMPGAGKSTVGRLLAESLGLGFVDTDRLIEAQTGRTLQEIVDVDGPMALRRIEEAVLLSFCPKGDVVSTGGSAVYSPVAMDHLKSRGQVVFLDTSLAILKKRVKNFGERGIIRRPDQGLEDLFRERHALYARYADVRVGNDPPDPIKARDKILQHLCCAERLNSQKKRDRFSPAARRCNVRDKGR